MGIFEGYTPKESTPAITPGNYRVAVSNVEESVSKSGNEMLIIEVKVSGSNIKIKNYLVKNEWFNQNLTAFYDAFVIERGDTDFLGWVGAMGGAKLVEDENGYLKIKRWLDQEKLETLPAWEGVVPVRQTVGSFGDAKLEDVDDGDLPF